jgi:hypothetical protein
MKVDRAFGGLGSEIGSFVADAPELYALRNSIGISAPIFF